MQPLMIGNSLAVTSPFLNFINVPGDNNFYIFTPSNTWRFEILEKEKFNKKLKWQRKY